MLQNELHPSPLARPGLSMRLRLTLLVVTINSWNRINIAARTIGGSYKPPSH